MPARKSLTLGGYLSDKHDPVDAAVNSAPVGRKVGNYEGGIRSRPLSERGRRNWDEIFGKRGGPGRSG